MSETTRRPPIRPVSRTAKKVATSLQDCQCFDEVDRRLRMGWSSADLQKFIQEESHELASLSANYVRKMIDEYRKSIPPAELLLTTQSTAVAMNSAARMANGLEELEKLQQLYDLQMERIKIDVETEKKINKLFPSTGREIFYAMKILNQSSQLKMDLGIAKRQLGEVSVNGSAAIAIGARHNDESVGKVMADPDSRRKVLGMVEALMTIGQKANIDAAEIVNSATRFAAEDVIDIPVDPDPVPETPSGEDSQEGD
jgi:hypothetical protein